MPSHELQGEELFESVTGPALVRKEQRCTNRCEYCWHDRAQRCMCQHARPHSLHTTVNVKVLVLMHSKEYLNPGTDAKLLLAMLPPERAKLYARLPPSNPACGAMHTPVRVKPCAMHRSGVPATPPHVPASFMMISRPRRSTGGLAIWRRCGTSSPSRPGTPCCCGPAKAR